MNPTHAPGSAQSIKDAAQSRASEYCGAVGRQHRKHSVVGTEHVT
jgi:hypothetical protein